MSVTRISGSLAGKRYGATQAGNQTVTVDTVTDTTASVTFTTIGVNTKVLIEVSAGYSLGAMSADITRLRLDAKVDGSSKATTGTLGKSYVSGSGEMHTPLTVTGRVVVNLASTGSHTVLAQVEGIGATTNGTATDVTLLVTVLDG